MKTGIVIVALILGLSRRADAGHVYTYGEFEITPTQHSWLPSDEGDYFLTTYMAGGGFHHAIITFRQGTLSWIDHTLGMQAYWFSAEPGDQFTSKYMADNPDKSLRDNDLHVGFDDLNDGDFFLGVQYESMLGETYESNVLGYGWMHLRSEGGHLHKLGDSGGGQLSGIEIGVQAVPEPGTVVLLGLAGLAVLVHRRFTRRAA